MNSIGFRINLINQRLIRALTQANRPTNCVTLMAVSKTRSVKEVKMAYAEGIRCFGENQIQEALPKIEALKDYAIEWHFIGRLQSNKLKKICQNFHWVETLSCQRFAEKLNNLCAKYQKTINVCIQVNIDNDPNKAGIAIDEVTALAEFIDTLPHLELRGLMTVPKKHNTLAEDRASYHRLKTIYDHLNQQGYRLDTLSMGMSADFEAAIAEGSTVVRIGKNLFGPFSYQEPLTTSSRVEYKHYAYC